VNADRLKAAIAKLEGSTAAAKLRQVMPEIDRKVHDGVRHEDIVATLNAEGIDVSLETFRKNLYRYRAKIRKPEPKQIPDDSAIQVNENLPHEPDEKLNELADSDGNSEFDSALDPKKRDQIGEEYLARRRPLIGSKNRST
jgi:hypothetical protein